MTRTEAIARINERLASLADDQVATVADMLDQLAGSAPGHRALAARELALIEQSKVDFREGRTSSLEDSESFVETELARRRDARSTA